MIVNLQGDLPNIDPQVIRDAAETALTEDCDIATVASKIKNEAEITNPNIVKIAIAFKKENLGQALYFSRCPIPYAKNSNEYFHHIGIYAYKKSALEKEFPGINRWILNMNRKTGREIQDVVVDELGISGN